MADGNSTAVNVYLSLGSNIAPEENLRMACDELALDYGDLTYSSVYRNSAVGFEGDEFLNMVVGFSTHEEPERIVQRLEMLHERAGRVRQGNPFCSRTLDADLLLYGSLIKSRLKLPHSDIEKYGFVLRPLAEVAPELRHPVSGETMQEIWEDFDQRDNPLTRVDIGIN